MKNRAKNIAGTISHGEQRQLEIAMTLATEPQVILLDEPLAGMGAVEAERMVALLLAIKKDHAILLVEHDMDAVFALADKLTVMVNGQVIASGTPTEIRADSGVQAAYLGEEYTDAFTMWMAGGGIKKGYSHGETDPIDRKSVV